MAHTLFLGFPGASKVWETLGFPKGAPFSPLITPPHPETIVDPIIAPQYNRELDSSAAGRGGVIRSLQPLARSKDLSLPLHTHN